MYFKKNSTMITPLKTIISSSRGHSKIVFYLHFLVFQLEKDHTPRKLFYKALDSVYLKKKGWGWWIWLVFTFFFIGVSFYLYFFESNNIYNVISSFLLLLMVLLSYEERKNKLIQVKKQGLSIDVFRSSNMEEIEEVLQQLKARMNENSTHSS